MIPGDSSILIRLVLAALTCFRLAQLITLDKGPWLIFERLRLQIEQFIAGSEDRKQSYFWRSVADGVSCPYCLGFYAGLLCTALVLFPTQGGDLFLLWFGIIGAQAFMQGMSGRE